jgi:threonine/homoserine/homoserine lactone efflux protein
MTAFVPDVTTILTFAIAALALAITPGPDMALFISRTINHGVAHGFATVLGALSGIGVHTMLVAFGISVLIIAAPALFWALKIGGALYLIYLAVQAFRDSGSLNVERTPEKRTSLWRSYLIGVGINLTNPKVLLFFITFLPQFVSPDDPAAAGKLVFLGVEFVVVAVPVVIAIVLGAEWLTRALKTQPWVSKALNWCFGGVFLTFAATILLAEGRK